MRTRRSRRRALLGLAVGLATLPSCSWIAGLAVGSVAGVFDDMETVIRSDDDLGLVEQAMAFNLKTLETLLVGSPENRDLLLAAAQGFMLYSYAFVEPRRFDLDFTQFEEEQAVRQRARRLYRRAVDYAMRGLAVEHPGIENRLSRDPDAAAADLTIEDASLALWAGTAVGAWIAMSTDDPEATADVAVMGALLHRSRELDDTLEGGVVYDYLMLYEASRVGGDLELARSYFETALERGPERRPVVWSSWAETGALAAADRAEFLDLLERTLAFDIDSEPDARLLNQVAKERATWLLKSTDDFFLDETD